MKHGAIKGTIRIISSILLGLLELILKVCYLLLPIGLYMALLQFRDKVSKASALSTFTNLDSTFQYIHPNFILVCVNPKKIKEDQKKFVKEVDKFYAKFGSVVILGSILTLLILVYVGLFVR